MAFALQGKQRVSFGALCTGSLNPLGYHTVIATLKPLTRWFNVNSRQFMWLWQISHDCHVALMTCDIWVWMTQRGLNVWALKPARNDESRVGVEIYSPVESFSSTWCWTNWWMRRIHTELYKSPVLKYCDVLQKRLHSELAYCWMVKTWSQSLNFDKTIPNQDPLISFFQCFQSRSSSEDGVCKVLMDMEQLTGELRSCHDFMQSTCLDFSSVLGQNLRTKVHSWVCK